MIAAEVDARRFSIVLEWDNVRLSDMDRCLKMLAQLREQIPRTGGAAELIVVFDELEISPDLPESITRRELSGLEPHLKLVFVAARNATYYDLKNIGVRRAVGDLVILLDSDVIPEPDWLENLLASFDSPVVQVVGSNSYIQPTSVYAKSFALGWLFPLRSDGGPLRTSRSFYANSVAFRREVIQGFPFPRIAGACRGSGHLLAAELLRSQITIYRNQNARVAHPAPRPRHFLHRGIAQGRDNLMRKRLLAGNEAVPFGYSWRDFKRRAGRALWRILHKREHVDLSAAAAPLAMLIIATFYALFLAGDVLTRLSPEIMQRRFRV